MNLHTFFLRFMLASLAVTAVVGVVVILFGLEGFGGRAVGTVFAATVASGLMARLAVVQQRRETRTAGLFGMGVVVLTFLLMVPMIWWSPEGRADEVQEKLWLTTLWLFLAGVAVFFCLLIRQLTGLRGEVYLGVGVCAVTFVELLVGTWLPLAEGGEPLHVNLVDERWLRAASATALFGLVATACLPHLRSRRWPSVGVVAAIVGWGAATFCAFWASGSDVGHTIITLSAGVALVAAYVNLLYFLSLPSGWEWARTVAVGTAGLTALGVEFLFLQDIWGWREVAGQDWVGRTTGAAAVLAGCDTLALIILAIIHRYTDAEGESAYPELSLTCPKCEAEQTVAVGKSSCGQCGLQFSIRAFEKAG